MSDKRQRIQLEPGEWVRWGCERCNWRLPTSCDPYPPPYDECPTCRLKQAHSRVIVVERGQCEKLFGLSDYRKEVSTRRKPPATSHVGQGGGMFDAKRKP